MILLKYANYMDAFLFYLVTELSEKTNINKDTIKLQKSKQPPYRSIYSLHLI